MSNGFLRRLLAGISSRRMGISCALLTAALCALGSFVLSRVPNIYRYRLWWSWSAPRWHTVWVDLLLTTVAIWTLSSALRLLRTIDLEWLHSLRRRMMPWLAVTEFAFAVSLVVYVWLVLRPLGEVFVVTTESVSIHGESYRALRLELDANGGMRRRSPVAWLERKAGAATDRLRLERGRYFSSLNGDFQLVMTRADATIGGAIVRHGGAHVTLAADAPVKAGLVTLLLRAFHHHMPEHTERVSHVEIDVAGKRTVLPLDPEWAGENAFLGREESPKVLLRVHRNHRRALAGLALATLLLGLLLIAELRRSQRSAP